MKEYVLSSAGNWTGCTPGKYPSCPGTGSSFFQVRQYENVVPGNDVSLFVCNVDNDFPIDRFSGGEQDDIAVARGIALSRYLAELHQVHESTFLIFDEIFGSQDEERRNNLLTALRTQESRFPRILLISHIPDMQGEFTNTLVIEMGADNASRIRVVE
jgi:exonuclease SbcC